MCYQIKTVFTDRVKQSQLITLILNIVINKN